MAVKDAIIVTYFPSSEFEERKELITLEHFETLILAIEKNLDTHKHKIISIGGAYSMTDSKFINAVLEKHGMPKLTKKDKEQYSEIEIDKSKWITNRVCNYSSYV